MHPHPLSDTHTQCCQESSRGNNFSSRAAFQKTLHSNRNWQFIPLLVHFFLIFFLAFFFFFIDRNHLLSARVQIVECIFV